MIVSVPLRIRLYLSGVVLTYCMSARSNRAKKKNFDLPPAGCSWTRVSAGLQSQTPIIAFWAAWMRGNREILRAIGLTEHDFEKGYRLLGFHKRAGMLIRRRLLLSGRLDLGCPKVSQRGWGAGGGAGKLHHMGIHCIGLGEREGLPERARFLAPWRALWTGNKGRHALAWQIADWDRARRWAERKSSVEPYPHAVAQGPGRIPGMGKNGSPEEGRRGRL